MNSSIRQYLKGHTSLLWDGFALALLSSVVLGAFLGNRPLANPDEGRYMEISREMLLSYDFITPTLNSVKYFENLFYFIGFNPYLYLGLG